MIDRDFIEKIEELSHKQPDPKTVDLLDADGTGAQVLVTVDEDGGHIVTPVSKIVTEDYEQEKKRADVPAIYGVETLDAFKALIPTIVEVEALKAEDVSIHVQSPTKVVAMLMRPDRFARRRALAVCDCSTITPAVAFTGKWMSSEEINILLQTSFSEDEGEEPVDESGRTMRERLMEVVGTLVDQQIITLKDDGITQNIEVREGPVVKRDVAPRLVVLRPYRTFRNLRQPGSPYLLRVRAGDDKPGKPTLALFETDGSAWRLEAMKSIEQYLTPLAITHAYHLFV